MKNKKPRPLWKKILYGSLVMVLFAIIIMKHKDLHFAALEMVMASLIMMFLFDQAIGTKKFGEWPYLNFDFSIYKRQPKLKDKDEAN